MSAFLVVCLNPVLQKTLVLDTLREGSVNRSAEYRLDASGKGINVVRVLTQLGERATQLTQAGGRHREWFLSLAAADGLNVQWIESGSEIRFCYTLVARQSYTTTEIVEEAEAVAAGTENRVYEAFEQLLPQHSTVIFSGSKAAGFSEDLYPNLVGRARRAGAAVILDVRGTDLVRSLTHEPNLVKPNYDEFVATFFEQLPADAADPIEPAVCDKLRELSKSHDTAFVLTRGAEPALIAQGNVLWRQAPEPIEPLNTTGSGDAFTAALASALARGASLHDAVADGHRAGARNAQLLRPGAIA